MRRAQEMEQLANDVESTPQERNFARMRLAERAGVDVNTPPIMTTRFERAPTLYRRMRLRDPIHAAASRAFNDVVLFEYADRPDATRKFLDACITHDDRREMELRLARSAEPAFAVRSFAKATLMDETAISVALNRTGTGAVEESYPRFLAALRAAVENRSRDPQLAAHALIGLSYFAIIDPSLGNHIKLLNTVLEPRSRHGSLRPYLTDEASVVFRRGTYKVLRQDVDGSLEDLTEALALAEAQEQKQRSAEANGCLKSPSNPDEYDFTGLVWSLTGCLGKLLHSAGRNAEALAAFESVVDAVDAALRDYPDDPARDPLVEKAPVSPITGGRERDPEKLAKLVSLEFSAAGMFLMEYLERKNPTKTQKSRREYLSEQKNRIAGDAKELRRRGLARYKSAAAREAALPAEALPCIDGQDKMLCQALLASMPATKGTEAAVNAGATRGVRGGGSLLECHGCGSVHHAGLKTCGGCMQAAYCSTDCQKAHWKVHKAECKKNQAKRAAKGSK